MNYFSHNNWGINKAFNHLMTSVTQYGKGFKFTQYYCSLFSLQDEKWKVRLSQTVLYQSKSLLCLYFPLQNISDKILFHNLHNYYMRQIVIFCFKAINWSTEILIGLVTFMQLESDIENQTKYTYKYRY